MRRWWMVLVTVLMVGHAPLAGQSPQSLPLIHAADVTLLGSFTVPAHCGSGSQMGWGGAPLGLSARGLYIGGYDAQPGGQQLAEFTIPDLGGSALLLTPCTAVPRLQTVAEDVRLGGVLTHQGRVIVSAYSSYDADGSVQRSHMAVEPTTGVAQPWVKVGTVGAGYVGGAMTPIPAEWQGLLGGPVLTGQASLSIISRTSSGPSAHVMDPALIGSRDPLPAIPLVYYPLDHPLFGGAAANPLYQRLDTIGGMAFPAGTRSVLFIGRHGLGARCYGTGESCGDPTSPYQGDHAFPYRFQVWAYDATDLLAVKNGTRQPWDVRPYATWTLPGLTETHAAILPGGATYDPSTRRLYVAPRWGGGERRIYVYAVDAPAPPTEPDPEPGPDPDPDIWEQVVTITIPATTVTLPAQTIPVPARTETRTYLCSRATGACVPKP